MKIRQIDLLLSTVGGGRMNQSSLKVLSAGGHDGDQWRKLFCAHPVTQRDIHYSVDYARIYEETYGDETLRMYSEDDGDLWEPL